MECCKRRILLFGVKKNNLMKKICFLIGAITISGTQMAQQPKPPKTVKPISVNVKELAQRESDSIPAPPPPPPPRVRKQIVKPGKAVHAADQPGPQPKLINPNLKSGVKFTPPKIVKDSL